MLTENVIKMAERGSSPTKKQIDFINKLREASGEREETVSKFLKERDKNDIQELSIPETSDLIDALKKIKVEGETLSAGFATGKQISFLTNLQDTEERRTAARDYLKNLGKDSVNELSINEASELIDTLMKMPRGERLDASEMGPTAKQIKFIQSLQKNPNGSGIVSAHLKKLKKESLEELTRKEASDLIEKLKS